ncbi:tetratricopeptide repeat protein [Maridesulfovibrio ferrireducens]|uniref:tetratricopeptide repeat protein n=1 Tax=Maridesulfovibrio ferrireducens TaxID=246191 RepID=UPI001A24271D|nr:tetratricopeptide repeat protein [Maridesulfovibrio ferrireducens]MBI9111408.1 tetratricopeptide repeat protein [Maridesulfovibrio ferrireducens]
MISNFCRHKFRPLLIALFLFFLTSTSSYAVETKNGESYDSWLEKYGAWDVLEENYSGSGDSPELIIKRAQTAYNLGRYSACMNILQGTPAFDDKSLETSRLWLGGQTQRALGDPVKSVIWFSQAARFMKQDFMTDKFKSEPNLKTVWFDVWRSLYWSVLVTSGSAREAQNMILTQSFEQAEKVWPTTYFIVNTKPVFKSSLQKGFDFKPALRNSTIINDKDRELIAMSIAASSLSEWDKSNSILEDISNSTVKTFWNSVNSYLETGKNPAGVDSFQDENIVNAWSFFKSGVLEPAYESPTLWKMAAPASPAWNAFRNKLMSMSPREALDTIDRETGSLLLSEELVSALQNYKLAFALLTGDMELAKKVWGQLDPNSLPMSLRIAAGIVFKPDFSKILSTADAGKNSNLFIISGLCDAAGVEYFNDINSLFWQSLSGNQFNAQVNSRPLDRLLLFSELAKESSKKMDDNIARRCAMLFPNSDLGARSFIYLADNAAQNRDFKLSAFYLKRVDPNKFGADMQLKWLIAAVEYDLAVGNEAKALKAYNEILGSGGALPPEKELRLALLIQQKGDLKKAQAILERIWSGQDKLDNELKAEILFWIAEGEQAMGDKDKALKSYLELAFKFPEQNIWAVTAMYRISMIYEHRGQFETAKKFLNTVIKNADRKAQKEAAKARLNAIDTKLAKTGNGKEASFPF